MVGAIIALYKSWKNELKEDKFKFNKNKINDLRIISENRLVTCSDDKSSYILRIKPPSMDTPFDKEQTTSDLDLMLLLKLDFMYCTGMVRQINDNVLCYTFGEIIEGTFLIEIYC